MNREQIEQFRIAITNEYNQKISDLQKEKEIALDLLSKLEERLCAELLVNSAKSNDLVYMKRSMSSKTIPNRMRNALNQFEVDFSRQELFAKIISDGNDPNISESSMAPVFSKFIKDGKIIISVPNRGTIAGTYRKATGEKSTRHNETLFTETNI